MYDSVVAGEVVAEKSSNFTRHGDDMVFSDIFLGEGIAIYTIATPKNRKIIMTSEML